jgi:hypothetical protein
MCACVLTQLLHWGFDNPNISSDPPPPTPPTTNTNTMRVSVLQVEKWEMLLPALALEYITGQPATFVTSSVKYYRSRNAATGECVEVQKGKKHGQADQ